MQSVLLGLFVVILSYSCMGQEAPYRRYTVGEGLPSMTVYRGLQATDGKLWLGTENGLASFDGYSFQVWKKESGLPDNEVTEVIEDRRGRVWFSCPNGSLGLVSGDSILTSANCDWIPQVQDIPSVFGELSDGRMVAGDLEHLVLFTPERTEPIPLSKNDGVRAVWDLGPGQIWFWTKQNHFVPAPGNASDAPPEELIHSLPNNWRMYREAKSFNVYTREGLEAIRKDSLHIARHLDATKNPNALRINHLTHGPQGHLWLGSYSLGLSHVAPGDSQATPLLANASIGSVFFDRNHNIWICTMGQGLYSISHSDLHIRNFREGHGLENSESICLGYSKEMGVIAGHNNLKYSFLTQFSRQKPSPFLGRGRARIKDIEILPSGHLLMATDLNILLLPPDASNGFSLPGLLPYDCASKDIELLSDKEWLVASSSGLIRFERNGNKVEHEFLNRERCFRVAIHPLNREVLVGSNEKLFFWKGEELQAHPLTGELNSRISDLEFDANGTLWVSTYGQGIFRVEDGQWHNYTSADGLPSPICTSLELVGTEEVWVGTDAGVARLRLAQGGLEPAGLDLFDQHRGLLNNYVNDVGHFEGNIWVATAEGVTMLNPHLLNQAAGLPCLEFGNLQVRGQDTAWQERLELPHWQNSLRVRLWDPCFSASGFQYRLSRTDSAWTDLDGNVADFPLLSEGHSYAMEFRAVNRLGEPGPARRMEVKILMPFYQTTWFATLSSSIVLLGLFGGVRWRRYQRSLARRQRRAYLKELSQMRFSALKSQVNPHFLFNSLHALQQLLKTEDESIAQTYIARFAHLVRRILDHSLEDFTTLEKELEVCRLYLNLESMRLHYSLHLDIQIDEQLPLSELWMPAMVLQPFLENAIWHGLLPSPRERKLSLRVAGAKTEIRIAIEDNGVGRREASRQGSLHPGSDSHSTDNLRERLSILNRAYGQSAFGYSYTDLQDFEGNPAGTLLEIRIPYLKEAPF